MTTPRSQQIDLNATQFYHVINRCVRQNFLCGFDTATQKDYSHRKGWIVSRIKQLAEIFAIKICAFAIMSNHYHLVLFVDTKASRNWRECDVIQRWKMLFPNNAKENKHLPHKIKQWRERLSSISWFMQCLNERIARAANDEDNVKGRFWEGRFKSQALLDNAALLAAMTYVDLNPIRAGIADSPEASEFTSIFERIKFINQQLKTKNRKCEAIQENFINQLPQPKDLVPFLDVSNGSMPSIEFNLSDYLELIDATGRIEREDKSAGIIPKHFAPILNRLGVKLNSWIPLVKGITKNFAHAVGAEVFLLNFGGSRKKPLKGLCFSKKIYKS